VDSGIDPSLFSQALMYHAHRYSQSAWAGEPEIDPTLNYEQREQVEGWEMTPSECLDLAYGGVLRERFVEAGEGSGLGSLGFLSLALSSIVLIGSSTACIINLNASSGLLRSAK
jgi:protein phosphatase PTC7